MAGFPKRLPHLRTLPWELAQEWGLLLSLVLVRGALTTVAGMPVHRASQAAHKSEFLKNRKSSQFSVLTTDTTVWPKQTQMRSLIWVSPGVASGTLTTRLSPPLGQL